MKKEQFNDVFPSYVVDFLNYYSVVKNRSSLTVLEYANDLATFFRFLKVIRGLADKENPFEEIYIKDLSLELISGVTLNDAYTFLVYCKDNRNNNEKTRARKATTLRNFYKYLTVQKRLIDDNPLQELDSPKIKKSFDGKKVEMCNLKRRYFPNKKIEKQQWSDDGPDIIVQKGGLKNAPLFRFISRGLQSKDEDLVFVYVSSLYISSEITAILVSLRTAAIAL